MSEGSAVARGKRLKRIRQLAGLTRDELAAQANVSKATISYWENASLSSLSDKGAEKVIKALAKYGVACSLEWLLLGIGNPPQIQDLMLESSTVIDSPATNSSLQSEIDLFQSHNPNSVVITVRHAAMAPIIEPGDKVGGIWQPASLCAEPDKICIVTLNQQLQVRKVKKTAEPGVFNLSYISYLHDLADPFEVKNVMLGQVAPIIRIWRTDGQ